MNYNIEFEYNTYQKNLFSLFQGMTDPMDNDFIIQEKCNKILNEYLAVCGLEVYVFTKASNLINITELKIEDSPINLTVKNLDVVKHLQKPEKLNKLVFVNKHDRSLMLAQPSHPSKTIQVKLDLTLKNVAGSAKEPVIIGKDFHFKTMNAKDLHAINEALEKTITEIRTPQIPDIQLVKTKSKSAQRSITTRVKAKTGLRSYEREEYKMASERKEFIPSIKETQKAEQAQIKATRERKALRKAGEKAQERKQKYRRSVDEKKLENREKLAEDVKKTSL